MPRNAKVTYLNEKNFPFHFKDYYFGMYWGSKNLNSTNVTNRVSSKQFRFVSVFRTYIETTETNRSVS